MSHEGAAGWRGTERYIDPIRARILRAGLSGEASGKPRFGRSLTRGFARSFIGVSGKRFSHFRKRSGRPEFLILLGDELGVLIHKNFTRRPKIEFAGMVTEKFAVNACPYQPPVRVDIDLGDAKLCRRQVIVFVDTPRVRIKGSARRIDASHLFFRNTRTPVHHDRSSRNHLLDCLDHFKMKTLTTREFVRTVTGTNRG